MLYIPLLSLCILSACNRPQEPYAQKSVDGETALCYLDDSTKIITHLIHTKKLSTILTSEDRPAIDRLIKNFSPAEIALESEVLNCTQPAIILFISENNQLYQQIHTIFESAANMHEAYIKFVEVHTEELFKITEQFDLEKLPAFVLMRQRTEVTRSENIGVENCKMELYRLINSIR